MLNLSVVTRGLGLNGVSLGGDAAGGHGAGVGLAPQVPNNVFMAGCAIVVFEARQGLGENVVVVEVFEARLARDIQPKAVQQNDVLIFHGGGVRADAEGIDFAVGGND